MTENKRTTKTNKDTKQRKPKGKDNNNKIVPQKTTTSAEHARDYTRHGKLKKTSQNK